MKQRPSCFLYCAQDEVRVRVTGSLHELAEVRAAGSAAELSRALYRTPHRVVVLDLRAPEALDVLREIRERHPDAPVITLGEARSAPVREARELEVFAVSPLEFEPYEFRRIVEDAHRRLELQRENRVLREEIRRRETPAAGPGPEETAPSSDILRHLSRAMGDFENPAALYDSLMDGLASALKVTRAGIFCALRDGGTYCLRGGHRCSDHLRSLHFSDRDRFVQWLDWNGRAVLRSSLETIEDPMDREMVAEALHEMGAELIMPLSGRRRVKGWLFLGARITGRPFSAEDLEYLSTCTDHIGATVDNALQHEDTRMREALGETLLESIPAGLIAIGEDGEVRWCNGAAQTALRVEAGSVCGMPVEIFGSRLSDILRRALDGEEIHHPVEWSDPATQRLFSAETRRLLDDGRCVGAVALIKDLTEERRLEEKEEQLERVAFWNELAASMSHEIRNPLVAIKTFAQLLPERYDDPEFRDQFSLNVEREVDRLNQIIDQINHFASPPNPKYEPFAPGPVVQTAVRRAMQDRNAEGLSLDLYVDDHLPVLTGDASAMSECLRHLVVNAVEAVESGRDARIGVTARRMSAGESGEYVLVTVQDNGAGIPEELRAKLFSPFCTTKARGMGLGLPIAKRIVVDHNGKIEVDSGQEGTRVSVTLPVERDVPGSDGNPKTAPEDALARETG
ncbi:ATP-binding protein [Kiritimatiella glycovorans]|uniref:histidine kinase n=1 Tax=Kiritimatiella glycovorans TaxID=1307763 RepID=A0A0G3EG72_9BACT|nr:ATP-binding protein [Kiritimatiella glycovorans]AKJ65333.1 Sensor protein ZraS [Kiritimatiella glycovorans]